MGDFRKVCKLHTTAPHMGAYVMDHYMDRVRVLGLVSVCKAFRPDISVEFLTKQMAFDDADATVKFLESCGAVFTDPKAKSVLDAKTSMGPVMAKASEYTKVDIRGQV